LDASLPLRGRVRLYLFGSAAHSNVPWSDIDALTVCSSDDDTTLTRLSLANICQQFPIDLLIMTVDEEAEFNFVLNERCREMACF